MMGVRKDGMGPLVPADYIKRLRLSLGLTQAQFAVLLEVGNVTVSHWEKDGMDGARNSSYVNLKTLVGLLRQAMEHPEMLNLEKLLKYLDLASRHELVVHYLPFEDLVAQELLSVINSGSVTGVVVALLLDTELVRQGRPTPYEKIVSIEDKGPALGGGLQENGLLDQIVRRRKNDLEDAGSS